MTKNCIIWPKNKRTESDPCFIHVFEREILGIGGPHSVQAICYDNYLLVVEGKMGFKRINNIRGLGISSSFQEVRRRGQRVDVGGYYLDPKEIV